ncbi:MAG: PAB1-binding protein PBP1 [Planctomycetota bacterium]|jgi:PAB1-binding protein PBP1
MPEKREEETTAREIEAQAETKIDAAASQAGSDDDGGLDLEDLDLTVETVEERISPSETNVFDK